MVQKGYFGLLGNAHILVYYPILSCQYIYIYRVETLDMGRFRWNNCVSMYGVRYSGRSRMVFNDAIFLTHF